MSSLSEIDTSRERKIEVKDEVKNIAVPPVMVHLAAMVLLHAEQFYRKGEDNLLDTHFKEIIKWDKHQCFLFVLAIVQAPFDGPLEIIVKNELLNWFSIHLAKHFGLTLTALASKEFGMEGFSAEANQAFLLDALSPQFVSDNHYRETAKSRLTQAMHCKNLLLAENKKIKKQPTLDEKKTSANEICKILKTAQEHQVLPYLWSQRASLHPQVLLKLMFAMPASVLGRHGLDKTRHPKAIAIIEECRRRLNLDKPSLITPSPAAIRLTFYLVATEGGILSAPKEDDALSESEEVDFDHFFDTFMDKEARHQLKGEPLRDGELFTLFNSLTPNFRFKPDNIFNRELIAKCREAAKQLSQPSISEIKAIFVNEVLKTDIPLQDKQSFLSDMAASDENRNILKDFIHKLLLTVFNSLSLRTIRNLPEMPPIAKIWVEQCRREWQSARNDNDIKAIFIETVLRSDLLHINKIAFVESLRTSQSKESILHHVFVRQSRKLDAAPFDHQTGEEKKPDGRVFINQLLLCISEEDHKKKPAPKLSKEESEEYKRQAKHLESLDEKKMIQ